MKMGIAILSVIGSAKAWKCPWGSMLFHNSPVSHSLLIMPYVKEIVRCYSSLQISKNDKVSKFRFSFVGSTCNSVWQRESLPNVFDCCIVHCCGLIRAVTRILPKLLYGSLFKLILNILYFCLPFWHGLCYAKGLWQKFLGKARQFYCSSIFIQMFSKKMS